MIRFYQVECPKCHGQINSTSPLQGPATCAYCGTGFHITGNMTKETEMPEQLVPFATTAADFERAALTMLVDEDYTPNNIFDLISFKDVKGLYLPAYLYEGSYECSWSCKIRVSSVDGLAPDQKKSDAKGEYRPQSGVTKGDYAIVCLAGEGVETSAELAEYVRAMDFDTITPKPFHTDDLADYYFLIRNQESKKTWSKWGEGALNNIAQKTSLIQLHSSDIKDFKCNVSKTAAHDGRLTLIPVWMANYQYEGTLHHIMMDGSGRNGVEGTTPVDPTRKARVEKPFKWLNFIAVAAIVVPLLMLLASWHLPAIIALVAMWLVFFGLRYFARWNKKYVISKARKQRRKIFEQKVLK